MKILAAGDIHGDTMLANALAEKAKSNNVDLVILCGDLTMANSSTDGIIGPFLNKNPNSGLMLLHGNHEPESTTEFLSQLYKVKNLHGENFFYQLYDNITKEKKETLGIFGCGGANIGINQMTESEIFSKLKEAHSKIQNYETKNKNNAINNTIKKLMVTHIHPSGSKMEKFSNFVPGSTGLKKAIEELNPDILLCSHIHEAEGLEETIGNTKVINVGREGKILEF